MIGKTMNKKLILMLTLAVVIAACGGNGGVSSTTAQDPTGTQSSTTSPPDEPDNPPATGARVGLATVVLDGQTLLFDSSVGTKTDWNFSIAPGCAPGNLGWVGISAAGVDAGGNHLPHEAWIDVTLPTSDGDSSELSFRLHTEDGLFVIDRDDPGTWDLDHDASGATASGEVNLVDGDLKEPVGSATFETSCR